MHGNTSPTLVRRLHNVQFRYRTPLRRFSSRKRAQLKEQTSTPLHVARCTVPMTKLTMRFSFTRIATIFATLIMAARSATVTRIACFRFKENVTPEQKGDRARAFLNLYAQHQDLILGMPKGGKPLNTPLNLTNVKRDSVWDTGFIVTFKVGSVWPVWLSGISTDAVVQSEEARLEFDKEPGHDKLEVSVLTVCMMDRHANAEFRKRRIHC